jgi:hypothetical protein
MIHSKPIYTPLAWDQQGHTHLLAAHGAGGETLLNLLAEPPRGPIAVLYAYEPADGVDFSTRLARTATHSFETFASIATMSEALRAALLAARMGLRLYLAGSERFLWSASNMAASLGVCADEIRREHVGSLARAVYCVHCKAITPQVTTNVVPCQGCARTLMVRDHYSARLAAYMGFQVDAEAPGSIPASETLYA